MAASAGYSGAFLGLNYSTNNFLGLGETLSLQANLGSVSRTFLFGFTQPYFRNRPINLGFQIFNNKQDYNAAKNYEATTGASLNLSAAEKSLTQNYNVGSDGIELLGQLPAEEACVPARGHDLFADQVHHHGIQHGLVDLFPDHLPSAPACRDRTRWPASSTAIISLTYTYDTVSNPMRPRGGKQYSAFVQTAGIWGSVRYVNPVVAYKQFIPMHYLKFSKEGRNVLARARAVGLHPGFWRRRGSAQQPLLRRRRAGVARL